MEQVIIDNYLTKSYKELSALLKAQWPEWEFKELSIKAVIQRLKLPLEPKRVLQRRMVDGEWVYFKFTTEMEAVVLAHYKKMSNREICELLKAQWPEWEFKPLCLRTVMARLGVARTKKQTHKIILRDCKSEFGKRRAAKVSITNLKHKIGEIFFSQQALFYGKLCIKVGKKSIMHYDNYLYEKYIGKIPKGCNVELIDPFGPVIPENLTLKKHNLIFLKEISTKLDDRFIIGTLVKDKCNDPEARKEFKNSPGVDLLIKAQRVRIELLRAIKDYKNARTAANTTDNKMEGAPEADD